MVKKVSAAVAKARLSALVAEVAFGGHRVVIERRGKPLAAIVSISDLQQLGQHPAASPSPRGALALVGGWKEVSEEALDRLISEIYEAREQDRGRPVRLEI